MMTDTLFHKMTDELIKRFTKTFGENFENWGILELSMKSGETCYIEVYPENSPMESGYGINTVTKDNESYYHFQEGMHALCQFLTEISEHTKDYKDSVRNLESFYKQHIQGHTREELQLGNSIFTELSHKFRTDDTHKNIFDFMENYMDNHDSEMKVQFTENYRDAYAFTTNYERYNDWYKAVHWHRPQVFDETGIAP